MSPHSSHESEPGNAQPVVAIVGGGASGALLATQLLRRNHRRGLRVVVIEPRSRIGPGLAYSTVESAHRLNVPAGQMGALPRDPGHFQRWANSAGHELADGDFAPRALYGEYLTRVLREAELSSLPGVELEHVRDRATAIRPVPSADPPFAAVELASGRSVISSHVVLALGNLPPSDPEGAEPELLAGPRYEHDPWDPELPARAARDDKVLLLGTGLTMVDVALSLAESERPATLLTVSRKGLLPKAHVRNPGPSNRWFELPRTEVNLSELVARLEAEIARAEAEGGDWRQVIDSLRPYTNRIWRRLNEEDRERFVRHLSRRWDVHRHRMAPEIGNTLEMLRGSGRLRIARGSVSRMRQDGERVEVTMGLDEGRETRFEVGRIINCTGPALDLESAGEPVLTRLFAEGAVRRGPLGLGLDHDSRGMLLGAGGSPTALLSTIGPLRKGRLWETTAIPEIRGQALELGDQITATIERSGERRARAVA